MLYTFILRDSLSGNFIRVNCEVTESEVIAWKEKGKVYYWRWPLENAKLVSRTCRMEMDYWKARGYSFPPYHDALLLED